MTATSVLSPSERLLARTNAMSPVLVVYRLSRPKELPTASARGQPTTAPENKKCIRPSA